MNSNSHDQDPDKKPTLLQQIGSVLSAAVGVQSSKNRDRHFKHGKLRTLVVAGVIYVALFIITVYSVVRLVLSQTSH
jgi:hypothetical protein